MYHVMGDRKMSINTLTPDQKGWVVSKVWWLYLVNPKSRGSDDDDSGRNVVDGSPDSWTCACSGIEGNDLVKIRSVDLRVLSRETLCDCGYGFI